MNVDRVTLCIVNDEHVFVVDETASSKLLWDTEEEELAIGRDFKGSNINDKGYIDMVFGNVVIFKHKKDAMREWVDA